MLYIVSLFHDTIRLVVLNSFLSVVLLFALVHYYATTIIERKNHRDVRSSSTKIAHPSDHIIHDDSLLSHSRKSNADRENAIAARLVPSLN